MPAVRIIIEAINGTIATGEADVVKASNCESAVSSDIDKMLLLPPLSKFENEVIRKR